MIYKFIDSKMTKKKCPLDKLWSPRVSFQQQIPSQYTTQWWEDPKVDSRRAATHAKHLQPFLFSYFSCFHWQNFFLAQSRAANESSCPKWRKFKDQRRKRKEVGVKWGKQRKTTEDNMKTIGNSALYESLKQKTHLWTDGLMAAFGKAMYQYAFKWLNNWVLYF